LKREDRMAVKVIIRRTVPPDRVEDLQPLFVELRNRATRQPGYISGETLRRLEGETLRRLDKPDEFLVISTWDSSDDWNKWATSQERNEVQGRIDSLLGSQTEYEIFHHGLSEKT
jgi:heme-degrading monooxygenase HmoA